MKKITSFVKESYKPWMIYVSVFALLLSIIFSVFSAHKEIKNANERLNEIHRKEQSYENSFLKPTKSPTFQSELANLNKTISKSWLGFSLEKVSIPAFILFLLLLLVPLLRFVIKIGIYTFKIITSKSRATTSEVQKLPPFQRYLLILLGLIVVMFAIIIALQIL